MTIGYDKPLYIMPFDHRGSFAEKLFGWKGALSADQTAQIAAAKQIIYDGFLAAVSGGVPEDKAGILVDEQFGAAILRDAAARGYATACPAEKSGQAEFDFEYGEDFAQHIDAFNPTFCKVLVRYNPEGDPALNRRQAARLKRLSHYLHGTGRSRFMFELLVPAEPAQLERLAANKKSYDLHLRPTLMVQAIEQLQEAGVEPDVWKIEGLDRRDRLRPDCGRRAPRRPGPRRLHHPRPRRRRAEGAGLAVHGRRCSWLHRFRRGQDDLLGSAGGLAGGDDDAGRGGGRGCPPLPRVRGHLRGGAPENGSRYRK